MPNLNVETTQLIIVAAVALAMLIQAFVLLAIFIVAAEEIRPIARATSTRRAPRSSD